MLDEFDVPSQQVKGLNLIPIVDMLTTIIFFLQMTVTFYSYSKHTLPPSAMSAASAADAAKAPPLNLRAITKQIGADRYRLVMAWQGANPSSLSYDFDLASTTSKEALRGVIAGIKAKASEIKDGVGRGENTLRITLDKQIPLQILVTIMDGVKEKFPDLVLSNWSEAETYIGASQ